MGRIARTAVRKTEKMVNRPGGTKTSDWTLNCVMDRPPTATRRDGLDWGQPTRQRTTHGESEREWACVPTLEPNCKKASVGSVIQFSVELLFSLAG